MIPHAPIPAAERGLVFMTGHNCAAYIAAALTSLMIQEDQNFDVLFVDDASTDGTGDGARRLLSQHFEGRHQLISSEQRKGKARHAHEQLTNRAGWGFVAILDADDCLVDSHIMGDLAQAYAQGYDVVWTNYETDSGVMGGNGPLDPASWPRGQGWKTSHFFSFRRSLIDSVPATYFQDDEGRWFECACDFAIAFPVLDQTRRYLYIPRVSYRYTASNPLSHHNQSGSSGLNSPAQLAAARRVLAKKPLPLLRDYQSHPPSVAQALDWKLSRTQEGLARCQQAIKALELRLGELPFQSLALQRLVERERIPLGWLRQAGGWALDVGLLAHLAEVLDEYSQPRVLEFGSGRGTKTLARLIANRGGSLISVEHDPVWHRNTSEELQSAGLSAHASVQLCPLVDVRTYDVSGRFYDMKCLYGVGQLDVVIVDGPPAKTNPLARLPALPSVAPLLAPERFHVLLDDYEREDEQAVVKLWREHLPKLRLTELNFSKGVAQLRR